MPIQRAKPLETLYDEVKQYDLVLVPDAPLASALNRHLDRPHLGDFATTPRRAAAGRREQVEERTVFLELLHETDLSWKQASYLGEEIIHSWEYTARPDGILEFEQFNTPAVRQAVAQTRDLDTTSRHLTDFTIDEDIDLAVVGYPQLTALERSILPSEYTEIDRFTDDAFDQPPFRLFDTSADIVGALLDTISPANADNTAVVLDAGSEFSTLVESAFDAAGIPFYGGPGFLDDPDHRAFVNLLRAPFRGQDVRVSDIKPVLQHIGLDLDVDHDEKRLHSLDVPEVTRFQTFCDAVESGTWSFERALSEYESMLRTEFEAFHDELASLGIATHPITEARVDDLEFYLQSYEVPVSRENKGVLLADAKSATHVDRPLVFYLGLDDGWTRSPLRRPWVDRDAEYDRHIRQFQLLLQNGAAQYYLVRDTVGGSPVTPCLYFEELLDTSFTRFTDLDAERYAAPRDGIKSETPFGNDAVSVEPTELTTISQSGLSTYVNSPRDYFFDRLVDSPNKDYFREGNLFHDFAEFYVHHPEVIAARGLDEVVDFMVAEMEPFVRDVDRDVRRTRYRVGVENIVAFLDENRPETGNIAVETQSWQQNDFAAYYDRSVDSDLTERWFENEDVGVKGKIDLVQSATRLVDYKSGSKKSATKVVKNSALEGISDTPNFQALLYLTHQRTEHPNEQLEFVFLHFLENVDDVVRGEGELSDTLTEITYYPTPYDEYIQQRAVFERLRDEGSQKCQKTLSQVAYDDYVAVFEAADFPKTRDSDDVIDSPFGTALEHRMKDAVGDYKYVETGCQQAIRELISIRNQNYFEDDLDAFESFVTDRLGELNTRRGGAERFPVAELRDEPNYRRVNHRDLLLEGDQ
ncbi:PD-(D/E)XK nuclease family protein [Halapricum desulfuricans]|uniref:PD-(D/E)XK endonuclease-like domain-containing protein n=1 Tax=Halapricum desulfuricans TaxID=2841257 RepID=A0A897N7Z7_9EURY|nr:PD-(D/E)XK nuclease family protein [Halapricum desulfuricans]QSG08571.1 Uncharacterized protein HSR122_1172 [Halapricum desulfuricans]